MTAPRTARRSLRETVDRAEDVLETVNAAWCDGIAACGREELDQLSDLVLAVRGLSTSCTASDVSDGVSALLMCLGRCGSVVVQSVCSLRGCEDAAEGGSDGCAVRALESLRGLSEGRLECMCVDEATAYELVVGRLVAFETMSGSLDVLVSGCMLVLGSCYC